MRWFIWQWKTLPDVRSFWILIGRKLEETKAGRQTTGDSHIEFSHYISVKRCEFEGKASYLLIQSTGTAKLIKEWKLTIDLAPDWLKVMTYVPNWPIRKFVSWKTYINYAHQPMRKFVSYAAGCSSELQADQDVRRTKYCSTGKSGINVNCSRYRPIFHQCFRQQCLVLSL